MKHLSSMALVAGIVSGRPDYARSEVASFHIKNLGNGAGTRHLQGSTDMTNSVTEGPVSLQQLQLIQSIISSLSEVDLPDGVDLTEVNVAVIITEVLSALGIDASASEGDLSEADMELIIQEIIKKAAELLGVETIPNLESCSVCGEGMKVGNPLGNLALEGQPEVACGALEIAGTNGVIPSDQCAFLPSLITDVCECVPSDTEVTTVPTPEAITTPTCVCSPLSYSFTINLNQNCDTNDFDKPGIGNTACQFLGISEDVDPGTLEVFDVQFLEVDTSGALNVINQDDTYNNVTLSSGDVISFESVSANLNPDEPLSNQLEYVPGGVIISLRAKSEEGETIVTNRVSWTYTNSCESLPVSVGDSIGWITLSDEIDASRAFCPLIPSLAPTEITTPSPTTAPVAVTDPPTSSPTESPTSAPVTSTDAPTSSPTKSPTVAPVASTDAPTSSPTDAPTEAPVAATDSPTKSPTNSVLPDPTNEPTLAPDTPTTTSPTTAGKAAKSFGKASKSDPLAKTVKDGAKSSKDGASMPAFAKTEKISKSASGSNSGDEIPQSTKSAKMKSKLGASADAKAQKISSKVAKQIASLSMIN